MDIGMLRSFLLLAIGLTAVKSFPAGAPKSTCLTMFPKHAGAEQQEGQSPYAIILSSTSYAPMQEVTVSIAAKNGDAFVGVQIRAHRVRGDTEIIMGSFTQYTEEYLQAFSCFGSLNNMLTHKNAQPKRNLTLVWRAPDVPVGDIVFTATIVSSFKVFWANVKSANLRDFSGSTNLGNLEQVNNEDPDIHLEGQCGQTKGCILFPRHCMGSDCQAAATFRTVGDYVQFELMGKAEGYISLGFSEDKDMTDDETLSCTAQDSRVTVQRGYNPALHNDRQYTVGLVNMTTVAKDGFIYCGFARPLVMAQPLVSVDYNTKPPTFINRTFDFSEDYYLFLGWGYTYKDTDVMGKHTELPLVTQDKVSLNSHIVYRGSVMPVWLQIHSCFGVVAWMLLAGLGTVLARHYREGTGAETFCGQKLWFQSHRILLGLAAILTAVSFIVVFVELGDWSKYVVIHAYLGIAVMAAVIVQIAMALLRPSPSSQYRPIYNWLHRILGKLTHIAAAVQIYFGYNVKLFPHTMRDFGYILVIIWVVAQIFWEIVMEIMACCKSRSSNKKGNLDMSNQFKLEEKYPEETSRVANIILLLYLITIVTITVAGLCAILLF